MITANKAKSYSVVNRSGVLYLKKGTELLGSLDNVMGINDFMVNGRGDANTLKKLLNRVDHLNSYDVTYSTLLKKGFVTRNGYEL